MMDIPQFHNKAAMFKFLKENKAALIAEKKFKVKEADSISYSVPVFDSKGETVKDITGSVPADLGLIKAKLVINTTGLLDSHADVHIKGIWKKNLNEQKQRYLLQEHQMKFASIISDNVTAFTESLSWKSLGFPNFEGKTEALIFESLINPERNPYMYEQYVKGFVKNHSVGMQYVSLFLCINSEEKWYREEKENWDKYISEVVNQDVADELGYFWAVTEAKAIEGSAVVMGSNYATPTISITEAGKSTSLHSEPAKTTQKLDYKYLRENLKLN